MTNPKKPQRLSEDRLYEIALEWFAGDHPPYGWRRAAEIIVALTAELEERTRERDEAVTRVIEDHAGTCWKTLHGNPPPLFADACSICRRVFREEAEERKR